MDDFTAWIGRSEERADVLDPARSNMLEAALGGTGNLKRGDAMPALHHWLHFWEPRSPDQTGVDGHPKRGGFLPPIVLPRRMWAGGRLAFRAPLILGEPVRRVSTIRKIENKAGGSGALLFLTVAHEIYGPAGLAVEEEQDLVYRAAPPTGVPTTALPQDSNGEPHASLDPDPVLLFRYSALTMNSHRIHYDLPYAQGEEGYPGLVVQGPLQATLLARLAAQRLGAPLASFRFRGVAPAFAGTPLALHAVPDESGLELWSSQAGSRRMTASAAK